MAAMVLCSRSGNIAKGQHEMQKVLVGVGLDVSADTATFTIGKTDAASYATAPTAPITDYICQQVQIDVNTHAGRVFYTAVFTQLMAAV